MSENGIRWRKSSYSNDTGGNCVEVGGLPSEMRMRDTKNRGLGFLAFTETEWARFLGEVKRDV